MKRRLVLLLSVLCVLSLLGGCAGSAGNTSNPGDEEERPTLNLFIINGNYFEGTEKDSAWEKIEDACNVNIEITGAVNNDDYYTTLSPRLNSASNMPDVFFSVPNGTGGSYYTWSNQSKGILYDWDVLMAGKEDRYPYLTKLFTSEQYKNIRYDSAHTLLPSIGVGNNGWGIYYRGDWLIKIGYYKVDAGGNPVLDANGNKTARIPVNMDEFQDVMKKFSDASYNLNSGAKTYGMSPMAGEWANNPLYHAFGAPTDYDFDENGNVEFTNLTNEYKNFLTWFQQCYSNGWIDPQFYTNTPNSGGSEKAFEEGRSGIIITNAGEGAQWVSVPMEKIYGQGTAVMGPPLVGTASIGVEGASGFSNWGGMWGGFSITKACKNTDAALRLFNYLYSPEGQMTKNFGIEGVHWDWNTDHTQIVANLSNRKNEVEGSFRSVQDKNGVSDLYGKYRFAGILGGDAMQWDTYDQTGKFSFLFDWNSVNPSCADIMAESAKYFGITKDTKLQNFTVLSSAMLKKLTAVGDLCDTYAVRVIAKQMNLTSDWDKLVADCKAEGYDQICQAYKEAAVTYGLLN